MDKADDSGERPAARQRQPPPAVEEEKREAEAAGEGFEHAARVLADCEELQGADEVAGHHRRSWTSNGRELKGVCVCVCVRVCVCVN